jgi:hypothetical protein
MAWITATTLDDKSANLQSGQIAAILERIPNQPQEGSTVFFAASSQTLEVRESPAELLRAIDTEEHPEDPPASPGNVW